MADIPARPATSPSGRSRRSALETVVDRIWRFFCSVRAAIGEIAFLTLLVLIGTLRGSAVPQWIADYIPALQGFVDRWYAWDVFRSPVFALTLAVIAVAIIVCTLNRVPGIWATINHPSVKTTRGFLRSAETSATFQTTRDPDDLSNTVKNLLAKQRYRVLSEKVGEETHIYADKNRLAKLGTFPFHLGLILLLVGGIVASVYGFRENELVIPEGSRRNVGHGTSLSVQLDRFRDTWTEIGIPAEYASEITVFEGGKAVKSGSVTVNNPMGYRNATIYQSSFGNAAQMTIFDASGNVIYSDAADLGIFTMRTNPDAPAGFIRLPNAGVQLTLIAPDSDPRNQPELDTMGLRSGQLWIGAEPIGSSSSPMVDGDGGVVVTQGQPARIGDMTVTFEREIRFTVLQVGYNPGVPIFIVAAFMLVGGLVVTFYFPHRRIRGIVSRGPDGAQLTLAPLAKRDWSGKRDFFNIIEKAGDEFGIEPEIELPKNASDYEYLKKRTTHGVENQ